MKKIVIPALLCIALQMTAYTQELVFNVKFHDADTMMVMYRGAERTDTIFTTNGRFSFKKTLKSPLMISVVCVKNQQSINALREGNERKIRDISDVVSRDIFFEKGMASVTCRFREFGTVPIVRASHSMQDKYEEFRKRFNPLVKMARTLIDSSYSPGRTAEEKKLINMLYTRLLQIENETAEKFVTENTDNAAGAYVLYRYCRIEDKNKLDYIYKLFGPEWTETFYLENIHKKIKALFALQPGQSTPDFTANTNGQGLFRLSSAKGRYVVLDFWGSWCMPCIQGMPRMKEYYSRYSDKITFIGIACNDKTDAWKAAIAQNALPWIQVLNDKKLDLAVKYNVEAYPTKILLDKEGRFIKAFTGESNQFYETLDGLK